MIINNNIPALNTYRQLGINQNSMQKSMEKLSSGLRINKAGDDAAGLAISEKMRGQIRGLDQASRNASDGISLIQTAEGALNETHNILQRMRELAVQSANDTNVEVDRDELQKEVDQLAAEISRISDTTEFNTQNLLGGKFEAKFQIGANTNQNMEIKINDMSASALGVEGNNGLVQEGVQGTTALDLQGTVLESASVGDKLQVEKLGETQTVGGISDVQFVLRDSDDNVVGVSKDGASYTIVDDGETLTNNLSDVSIGTGTTMNLATDFTSVKSGEIEITTNGDGSDIQVKADATLTDDPGIASGTYTVSDSHTSIPTGSTLALVDANGDVAGYGTAAGAWIDKNGEALFGGDTVVLAADDEVVVGGDGIDISSQASANKAIETINNAIETVSAERSKLGANQNRLEHTIANLDNSSENLSAAESRIRDVDMAKEMMEMTRANILSQASQSMLAQANNTPQSVLQLLG